MQGLLTSIDTLKYEEELNKLVRLVIPGNVKVITKGAILGSNSLKEIVFENGVQEIQTGAITSCPNLERVVLPESITSIGDDNLVNCKSVREIEAPPETGNTPYWGFDGVLYRRLAGNRSELFYYPPGKQDSIYQFPENVRCGFTGNISPFRGAAALIALQIPNRWLEGSVTNLKQLLDHNSLIKELHVQSDVFPEIISSDALNMCRSMHLALIYKIANTQIVIKPYKIGLNDIDASSNGKEIPFSRVRAAQLLVDNDVEHFAEWAGDALKRKKVLVISIFADWLKDCEEKGLE